ncbi:MAG: hypothetical protein R2838_26620 [Caldilineaceae bacterium]
MLVIDSDGNVVTVDPDGTDRFALTTGRVCHLMPPAHLGARCAADCLDRGGAAGEEQITKLVTVSFDNASGRGPKSPLRPSTFLESAG